MPDAEFNSVEPAAASGARPGRNAWNRRWVNQRAFEYYPQLGRVQQYVDAHLADDLSVHTIAAVAGLSDKYFSTFFRSKAGVRFQDWIHSKRVNRAMQLLKAHDGTVTSIAYMAGYQDVRTFERAFKKFAGTTPRRYKKYVRPS